MLPKLFQRRLVLAFAACAWVGAVSPVRAEPHAEAPPAEHGTEKAVESSDLEDGKLKLGKFAFDDFHPTHQTTPHVEFALVLVLDEKTPAPVQREMLDWKERMRDQAIIAVRGAEPTALAEPELVRVRRLILLRLRRLPLPAAITDVYLTEFSVEDKE